MVAKYTVKDASINILTTELDGLVAAGNKITTTAIVNSVERDLMAVFRLSIAAQAVARSANAYVAMYFLPEEDGTFAYGGDALDPSSDHYVYSFNFDASVTARNQVTPAPINLPCGDFHVLLINETGQALAATGNVLSFERLDGGYEDV